MGSRGNLSRAFLRTTLCGSMLFACWSACATSASAVSFDQEGATAEIVGCEEQEPIGRDLYLQDFAGATEATGGVGGFPDRALLEVDPGQRTTTCVGFANRTGAPVTFEFDVVDVATGRGNDAPIKVDAKSPFGAASWITATERSTAIPHGKVVWLRITIDVPEDATPGSYYSAVRSTVKATGSATTRVAPGVDVQVFFSIPGEADGGGEILDVTSPRVVWWDGFDLGDLPVLEKARGLGIAPIRFTWRNEGRYTDSVGGTIEVESDIGGKDVVRLDFPDRLVLRGGDRDFEVTWSRDIPLVGRFTPTIKARTLDGKVVERELPAIWVIPSWWYIVALVLAIAGPILWRRRTRRRYDELLYRLEQAEGSGSGGDHDPDAWDADEDGEWKRHP